MQSGRSSTFSLNKLLAAWLFCFSLAAIAFADTHYVSHSGSNTFPYTSWSMATDSVRAAVDAADEWDTIRVASGLFTSDSIPLKRGQVLLGSGMDSTTILQGGSVPVLVVAADSCRVEGLHLRGTIDSSNAGLITYHLNAAIVARNAVAAEITKNRISRAYMCIYVSFTDAKRVSISQNVLHSFRSGVYGFVASTDIDNNYILINHRNLGGAIYQQFGDIQLTRNRIERVVSFSNSVVELSQLDTVLISNNIVTSIPTASLWSIVVNLYSSGYPTSGVVINNLSLGSEAGIGCFGGNVQITNNIIASTVLLSLLYDTSQTTPGGVGFNLYWDNEEQDGIPDTTARLEAGSLFGKPMFVDTVDFQLQAFSPAIDRGDTAILDVDGSRSDIGPHGGSYGSSYAYIDLPPMPPSILYGAMGDSGVALTWSSACEADFSSFEVLRDTMPIPSPDSELLVAGGLPDTVYIDTSAQANKEYFYRIRALDSQGNASDLSNEIHITTSGIADTPVLPLTLEFEPPFPNPFNESIWIGFSLSSMSPAPVLQTVRVDITDVIGRHVKTLSVGQYSAGEYHLIWDGADDRGNGLPSGVYFVTIRLFGRAITQKVTMLK